MAQEKFWLLHSGNESSPCRHTDKQLALEAAERWQRKTGRDVHVMESIATCAPTSRAEWTYHTAPTGPDVVATEAVENGAGTKDTFIGDTRGLVPPPMPSPADGMVEDDWHQEPIVALAQRDLGNDGGALFERLGVEGVMVLMGGMPWGDHDPWKLRANVRESLVRHYGRKKATHTTTLPAQEA